MKYTLTLLILLFHSLLIAQVYSKDAGFFDPILTANDYKFIMITVVSVGVALLMDAVDPTTSKMTFPKCVLIILLASIFVFFTYEYAIGKQLMLIIAMVVAFLLGVFSLDIMIIAKRRIPEIFQKAENWIFKKTKTDGL